MVSGNRWTIGLSVPLEPYDKTFAVLEGNIEKLKAQKDKPDVPETINDLISEEVQQLSFQVSNVKSNYLEINKLWDYRDSKQKRDTEGLIPIIGDAAALLFGTATKKDFRKLKAKAESIKTTQNGIRHNLKEQISVIESINNHQNITDNIIKGIANATAEISKECRNITSNFIFFEKNVKVFENKLVFISNLFRKIEFQITLIKDSINELKTSLQLMSLNHLSDFFLTRTKFYNALKDVENFLPPKFQMIYPVLDIFLHQYYDLVQTHATIEDNMLQILIEIPLKTPNRAFQLFKILPMPQGMVNSSYSVFIAPPFEFLAVSLNKLMYIPLSLSDIFQCRQKAITICPPTVAIRKFSEKTCIYALYNNQTVDVHKYCDKMIMTNKDYPIFYRTKSSSNWIFSAPTATKATFQCLNANSDNVGEIITLQGNGVVHIPFSCDLIGDTFHLDAAEGWQKDYKVDVLHYLPSQIKSIISKPEKLILSEIKEDPIKQELVNKMLREAEKLDTLPIQAVKIKDIKTELDKLSIEPKKKEDSLYIYLFATTNVLLFIILIAIFIRKCWVQTKEKPLYAAVRMSDLKNRENS